MIHMQVQSKGCVDVKNLIPIVGQKWFFPDVKYQLSKVKSKKQTSFSETQGNRKERNESDFQSVSSVCLSEF